MKKIAKSLMMIAAVAVMAIGATGAYFTDQVEVTGNTLETGTIAIDVDGEVDSNHASYNFPDMKPGFVVDSDFVVNNTGSNPANITKKLVNVTDKGLANVIEYKLAVEVHDANGFVWGQTLYNYDVTVNDIRGTNMFLGMLPAGWHMNVIENYRMKTTAGNVYQGRTMGFDIQVLAEQLKGSVVLEDKNPTGWDVNQSSAVYGTLTYGVMDSMFNYSFCSIFFHPALNIIFIYFYFAIHSLLVIPSLGISFFYSDNFFLNIINFFINDYRCRNNNKY